LVARGWAAVQAVTQDIVGYEPLSNLYSSAVANPSDDNARGKPVKKLACMLAVTYSLCGQASFADEFEGVKCGTDIPKALIGKRSSNGPVAALEKKYSALGLKDLGGDEISDGLSSVNMLICGAEYIELIDRRGTVRDVLPLPPHSKNSPAFSGMCRLNGKDRPDIIIAVLDGAATADLLPAKTAWKIDRKQAKFVPVSGEGMLCPRSGVYTVDDGR
jgi:hypothetical protein